MYLLNTRTHIYHTDSCHYGRWIQSENLKVCEDIPEGEIPCSCCKPAAEHHHRVNLDDGETTVWDEYLSMEVVE